MIKHITKPLFLLTITLITVFTSCKKDNNITSIDKDLTRSASLATIPGGGNPNSSGSPVTRDANGNYWAAAINVGQMFTHPTSIQSWQHGTSWSPGVAGAVGNGLLSYTVNGPYYLAIFSSAAGGLTTNTQNALHAYGTALSNYLDRKANGETIGLPNYATFANQFGASGDGTSFAAGQFIIDRNSPTLVSTVGMDFVPNTAPTGLNTFTFDHNGVTYTVTGNSWTGVVSSVTASNNTIYYWSGWWDAYGPVKCYLKIYTSENDFFEYSGDYLN
jgi:hypothetical protein